MLAPLLGLSFPLLLATDAPPAEPAAEPPLGPPLEWIRSCLGDARSETAVASCRGRWANECQTRPAHMPTVGISGCLADELAAWEELRLEVHARLLKSADEYDLHMPRGGPSVRTSLQASKAAWEAYRDAHCEYEYSEYAGGTMRGPVAVACKLRLTAERYDAQVQHGWRENYFESFRDARLKTAEPAAP